MTVTRTEARLDVLRAVAQGRVRFDDGDGYWLRLPGMAPDDLTTTKQYNDALTDLRAHGAVDHGDDHPFATPVWLTEGGRALLRRWSA